MKATTELHEENFIHLYAKFVYILRLIVRIVMFHAETAFRHAVVVRKFRIRQKLIFLCHGKKYFSFYGKLLM